MPIYDVTVEDTAGALVLIQVHARDPEEAEKKARAEIFSQTTSVYQVVEVLEIGDGSVARVFYLNGHAGTGKSFTYRYRCTVV